MKKRVISLLLVLALLVSAAPSALAAGGGFQFMQEVENALPEAAGVFLDGTPDLPKVGGTGFIRDPGGDLPEVREDGFLIKPTAPLKTFTGELLAEVSQPEEGAIEIATAEDLQKLAQGGSFLLTADIDLSSEGVWTPIQVASNTAVKLDGLGAPNSPLGLMRFVSGLEVRNLILRDVSANVTRGSDGYQSTWGGALAASVNTYLTLDNCVLDGFSAYSSGETYRIDELGGFVGVADCDGGDVILRDCAISGIIDLPGTNGWSNFVGGLVGDIDCADAELTDCLSDVDILVGESCEAYYVGGFSNSISASGSIDVLRCVSSGKVEGTMDHYSGIATLYPGSGETATLRDCLFNGSLTETDRDVGNSFSAGLASTVSGASLELVNCRSEGFLSTDDGGLGGLVGRVYAKNSIIRHCLADSDIHVGAYSRAEIGVGGLIGTLTNTFTLEDCLASGTVSTFEELDSIGRVGGLVGYVGVDGAVVERCVHTGTVSGSRAGGLVGMLNKNMSLTFRDCSHTGTVHGIYRTDDPVPSDYNYGAGGGLMGVGHASFDNCVAGGTVTGDAAGGLLGETTEYSSSYSSEGLALRFTDCRADLTLNGRTLGGLMGRITEDEKYPSVSFENCAAAVESDTSYSTNNHILGGLMGQGFGTFRTCQTECIVSSSVPEDSGRLTAGGLIGQSVEKVAIYDSRSTFTAAADGWENNLGGLMGKGTGGAEMNNCVTEVDFSSANGLHAGGLGGNISGSVLATHCTATGSISNDQTDHGRSYYFGGLFGSASVVMGQCCADVDLDASLGSRSSLYAGGLVGSGSGTIYSCWASGSIAQSTTETEDQRSGWGTTGGLIGRAGTLAMQDCCYLGDMTDFNTYSSAGGIVGSMTSGILRNCYVEADISGPGSERSTLGGIAGSMTSGTIRNCFLEGSATGSIGSAGGILGNGSGIIDTCTVSGTVTGTSAGGIAGSMEGTIRDCTFNGTVRPGSRAEGHTR